MGKMKIRKLWVLALCCALATGSLPRIDLGTTQLTNAMQSIFDLQAKLEQLQQPVTDAEPFVSLYYDAKKDTLYRDGVPVGDRLGEYAVIDGNVMLSAKAAGTDAEKGGYVSLEKAAEQVGCQVSADENGVTVTSPFDSACLIVKSESAIDYYGAIDCAEGYQDLYVLQYATPADAYAAYQKYVTDDRVIFAEPSRTVSVASAGGSADAYSYSTDENTDWGVSAIGADSYNQWLTAAYDSLPEIVVAVVDTGLYFEHERLQGRIAGRGTAFLDENQYSVDDEHGHGTHCAAIITGATTDNVKILPVRSLDGGGYGSILGIYCGMIYALEQGVDVVSMSLGIDGESPLVMDAARQLYEAGIPCCVASGNESMNADYVTPARSEHCLTVGALDENLEIAYFSNYGEIVDLAAPGVDVLSADITAPDAYVEMSGTSMATPYVAACCAMVLSADADLSVDEVESYLKANAMDLGESGRDDYYGDGMVYMADFRFNGDRCESPYADVESGSYDEALTVTLGCNTEGAQIYYTLDGSVPTAETGTLYTAPIEIASSAVLSAIAVYGELTSSVMRKQYLINGEDVADALVIENGVLVKYNGVLEVLDLTDLEGLTAVGDEAFQGNRLLEEVLLPDSVTSIGNSAFENCVKLWNMEAYGCVSVGDAAFRGCTELNWADTDELTSVGVAAFENCRNLYRITLSPLLTEIPARMLKNAYYSDSLYLPNVSVVGDEAFTNCASIQPELVWEDLTFIGTEAFAGCSLTDQVIALESVVTLGEGAFRGATEMKRFSLPANITTIPAHLLEDACQLEYISAPGVTAVEDYGLSVFSDSDLVELETDIPFEKINSVGEGAFLGFPFAQFAEFSQLTEFGTAAFAMASGAPLSFPAMTAIPAEGFVLNDNAILYFENASSVGDYAFSMAKSIVVLSETCTDFGEQVFAEHDCVLAAPAGSAAESIAEEYDVDFIPTPSAFAFETDLTFNLLDTPVIEGYALGFDLSYQWYDAAGTPIAGATEYRYFPTVSAGNSDTYTLVVMDADGQTVDAIEYTVTVKTADISYQLQLEQTVISDYENLYDEWKVLTDNDEWMDFTIYRYYSFTPEADGTYYFTLADDFGSGQLSLYGVDAPMQEFSNVKYVEADLTASEEYILVVQYSDADAFVGALGVTANHPEERSTIYSTYWMDAEQYETVVPESYPYEPHPQLFDYSYGTNGLVLTEGEDYILVYKGNDGPGTMFVYAFGIGNYIGCADVMRIMLTLKLQEEVPFVIEPAVSGDLSVTFIPESSGEYLISTAYPIELLLENPDTAIALVQDCDPVLDIYDADGLVDMHCDDFDGYWGSTYLSAMTVELTAGTEYTILTGCYSEGPFELMATKNRLNLLDCCIMAAYYEDGVAYVEVANAEAETLTENVDYRTDFFEQDGNVYVVVYGIGSYYGSLYSGVDGMGISSGDVELEPCVRITPDVPFTYDPTAASYRFTVEDYSTSFMLLADEHEWQEFKVYSYYEDEDVVDFYTSHTFEEEMYLGSGEYILIFTDPASVAVTEMVLKTMKKIDDAEIVVNDLVYNGEPQMPEITVTYDGVLLEEGVDYWVELYDGVPMNCGTYGVFINGMGDYTGMAWVEFTILPNPALAEGSLYDGVNTIDITEAGVTNTYSWIPEKSGTYGFVSMDLYDVSVTVMTAQGDTLCTVEGYDEAYSFATVTAGTTYYVAARYDAVDMVGSFSLLIQNGMRDLAACDVVVEETLYVTGDAIEPAFTVYDGDKALVEGVDYYVVTYGANTVVGRGVIELKGMGSYIGRLEGEFPIYMPELSAELLESEIVLTLDEYREVFCSYPGCMELYSFTNNEGADGMFTVNEEDYDAVLLLQAYDSNGLPITDFNPDCFTLAAGEAIYLLAIVDWVMWYEMCSASFTVEAAQFITLEHDGLIYEVDMAGNATLVSIAGDRFCYEIPDTFYDDTYLNMEITVVGHSYELFAYTLWNQQIFYVESLDSLLAMELAAYDYVVVCLDNIGYTMGDADGNGLVEMQDAILLNAWITEVEGAQIAAENLSLCDCNSDGFIDYTDVALLLEAVV